MSGVEAGGGLATSRVTWGTSLAPLSRDSASDFPPLPILANLLTPRSRLLSASRADDFSSESPKPLLRLFSRDCRSRASFERGGVGVEGVEDSAEVEPVSPAAFNEFKPPFAPPPLREASLEEPLRADSFPAGLGTPSSCSCSSSSPRSSVLV